MKVATLFSIYVTLIMSNRVNFTTNNKLISTNKSWGTYIYVIALVIIVLWAIGFLGYHAGGLV